MNVKFDIVTYDGASVLLKIHDPYDFGTIELVKAFPERRWVNDKYGNTGWAVPVNSKSVEHINRHWLPEEYTKDEGAKLLLDLEKLSGKLDEFKSKRRWDYLFDGTKSNFSYPTMRSPFDHQRVTTESMVGALYFGLLMEMGTGKTKCIIDELSYYESIRKDDKRFLAIIVCPKALLNNWAREIDANMPSVFERQVMILRGDKCQETMIELLKDPRPLKIVIVAYDTLINYIPLCTVLKPQYIAFDESHYVKNSEIPRFKVAKAAADCCEMRRIMTGTPSPNNILDIWAQFQLLKEGALGYNTFAGFRNTYAEVNFAGQFEQVVGFKNVDKLKQDMSRMSFIVRKDQCLDLPAKTYQLVEIDMPPTVRAQYDSLAKDFYLLMDDGTQVQTEMLLVQMLKLSQACSGFVVGMKPDLNNPDVAYRNTVLLKDGDAKMNAMIDDIESACSDGKAIVWSRFRIDNVAIQTKLEERGIKCGVYDGSVSDKDRQKVIDGFNNDDSYRVFIGNPGAGGVGITLLGTETVRTKTVYYYNNDFSYGKRLQSEDRCHRIGLRNPIIYKDYAYSHSIEQYIAKKLQNKKDLDTALKDTNEIKNFLLTGEA